jgi:hypothetical protein
METHSDATKTLGCDFPPLIVLLRSRQPGSKSPYQSFITVTFLGWVQDRWPLSGGGCRKSLESMCQKWGSTVYTTRTSRVPGIVLYIVYSSEQSYMPALMVLASL